MIGTWQTRPSTGWPNALDPFDSLVLAVQPGNVDLGLTWYTKTEAKSSFTQSVQDKKKGIVNVSFAVRRGPSRNFAAPDATATHTYTFPQGLDEVRHGPPRRSSRRPPARACSASGPAFLVTDPHTAGVYDTVYVDLDDDYSLRRREAGHQVVAGVLSRHERRRRHRHLRRPPVLHLGRHGRPGRPPGRPDRASASSIRDAPGALLAWTGDFDPAIEGHGTLTASNVVGQGVVNGLAPTFADVPGGTAARHGHRRRAEGEACPDGRHLLLVRLLDPVRLLADPEPAGIAEIDTRTPTATPDPTTTASTRRARRPTSATRPSASARCRSSRAATARPATARRTRPRRSPACASARRPSSARPAGTRSRTTARSRTTTSSAGRTADPARPATNAIDVVADGAYSSGDATLNTIIERPCTRGRPGAARAVRPRSPRAPPRSSTRPGAGRTVRRPRTASRSPPATSSSPRPRTWATTAGRRAPDRSTPSPRPQLAAGSSGAVVTPVRVAAGRLSRHRLRGLPAHPRRRRVRQPDVLPRRPRDVEPLGPLHDQGRQRGRSRSRPRRSRRRASRTSTSPDYLIDISDAVAAHPNADMIAISASFPLSEFDVDSDYTYDQRWRLLAYDWTDIEPRRQPVDRQGPRRRRGPQGRPAQLEHRRQPRRQVGQLRDRPERVRALQLHERRIGQPADPRRPPGRSG